MIRIIYSQKCIVLITVINIFYEAKALQQAPKIRPISPLAMSTLKYIPKYTEVLLMRIGIWTTFTSSINISHLLWIPNINYPCSCFGSYKYQVRNIIHPYKALTWVGYICDGACLCVAPVYKVYQFGIEPFGLGRRRRCLVQSYTMPCQGRTICGDLYIVNIRIGGYVTLYTRPIDD